MDEIIFSLLENLPTILLFVVIVITLNTLGKGADILVEEAVKISVSWGVSKTIIGATIVSLGTTIPEVTVSVAASLRGFSDMAIGNAVGSIITNTALIIGIVSIVGFVPVEKEVVDRQGKVQLLSVITLFILSLRIFGGSNISRLMGIFLLILLVVYTIVTISWSKKSDVEYDDSYEEVEDSIISQILMMILGLFIVIASSKILIPSVEIVATRIGIPQSVIAATLIAFGTSLPELITSVTAVRKGYGELAVGNIIGANILNVLFVIGASATVSKTGLNIADIFYKLQFPTMLIIIFLFHFFINKKDKQITKKEGIILLSIYFIYLILNFLWM